MKLRLRSFDSKETLKFEVPNSCTLSELRQTLVQALPNSPALDSIRLSLNRKDDLVSEVGDPLPSLGISYGDLIYFSIQQPAAGTSSNTQINLPHLTGCTSSSTQIILREAQNSDFVISGGDSRTKENTDRGSQMEEHVEVDVADKSFSVPGFLRKVFMEELGDDTGKDHKLCVVAIHAIMLETGFVGFDNKADAVVNGFRFRDSEWPSSLFRVSLHYTVQENQNFYLIGTSKSVVLKFQSLGKFINVYGTLENGPGKRATYRVQFNEDKLVPFLNVVWANDDVGLMDPSPDKEVFEFWRSVKDNLALPLLIDLCDELGLELPPCFMQLPTDLKMKILESLPGVEIAKMSCVCLEMRYLGSNDDLWKIKFAEEFVGGSEWARGSWKRTFAKYWDGLKSMRVSRARMPSFWPAPYWAHPMRRHPNPFMVARAPRIIGGDYDLFNPHLRVAQVVGTCNFLPECSLGVRGGRFV